MPLLSDDLNRLYAMDAMFRGMGNMANRSFALAAPWANIPPSSPPPSLVQHSLLRNQLQQQEGQQTARSKLLGGRDPQTGITWNQGRPGLLGKPEGMGLVAQAAPEAFMGAALKNMFTPQYGTPQFDEKLGKYYQVNPTSGKREYTSPLTGMEVTLPDGTILRTGVPTDGSGALTKPVRNKVQEKILASGDTLAHLSSIRQAYRPEFLEIGTRWEALKTRWKSKLGMDIDPSQKQLLTDFTNFRSDAGQLFALTLKDLSGVAVNPTEYKRAEAWLPNPGTGVFDGDSPEELISKIDRFEDFTRRATLKYNYINKHGLTVHQVDVDDMPSIIQKRGDALEAQYRAKGLTGQGLTDAVKATLAEEFGAGTLGGIQ